MKVYKIFTRKPDFQRLFGEEAQIRDREFFVVTKCEETFRTIALDKFYNDNILLICKNRIKKSVDVDLDSISFEQLKEIVIPVLFSNALYNDKVVLDSQYEQFTYAVSKLALMVSLHIELRYASSEFDDFHTYFGVYNIEEQDDVESVIFQMDKRYLRYEMNKFI